MNEMVIILILILLAVCTVLGIVILLKIRGKDSERKIELERLEQIKRDIEDGQKKLRSEFSEETMRSVKHMGEMLSENQKISGEAQVAQLKLLENRFASLQQGNFEQLRSLREENNKKLDEMRAVVDEKLQNVMEQRIKKSFELINEQLAQVNKGLGEIESLKSGVSDLQKTLSNPKTRGIMGETQLKSILMEILTPEQYSEQYSVKKGERVDFAVKMPNEDGSSVYLPIDSKFPTEDYLRVQSARENGNKEEMDTALKQLRNAIRTQAKSISAKYIDPPNTTEFALMFLPFEGLYAQVADMGLVEELQRDFRVNIAGPSTMAALLNSLKMAFNTFAVKKNSSDIIKRLIEVKKEFEKFGGLLESAQDKLRRANDDLEKLSGTRSRAINKHLDYIAGLPEAHLLDE